MFANYTNRYCRDSNDKLMVVQSQSMDRSHFQRTATKRTGSLSAPDVNSMHWQQSTLKKACCGIPTRVHPHLPGFTLTQYTTWLAAQKARTSSRGHHRGSCIIQCGGWLTATSMVLYTSSVLLMNSQGCQIFKTNG